jgi:hypothetical protein
MGHGHGAIHIILIHISYLPYILCWLIVPGIRKQLPIVSSLALTLQLISFQQTTWLQQCIDVVWEKRNTHHRQAALQKISSHER